MIDVLAIMYISCTLTFAYFILLILSRTIINKKYDKKFGIDTTGVRSWEKGSLYNRTESTPYLALNDFATKYTMETKDGLVDFGSGKGRVSIFMHNKFNIAVTGIELNELTYNEAVNNIDSYLIKTKNVNKDLFVKKEYAEEYIIKENENKFFFFNPFDISIFKKVVNNIIEDSKTNNKTVEIILYYPLPSYNKFLNYETPFILNQKIKTKFPMESKEKFVIYKLIP